MLSDTYMYVQKMFQQQNFACQSQSRGSIFVFLISTSFLLFLQVQVMSGGDLQRQGYGRATVLFVSRGLRLWDSSNDRETGSIYFSFLWYKDSFWSSNFFFSEEINENSCFDQHAVGVSECPSCQKCTVQYTANNAILKDFKFAERWKNTTLRFGSNMQSQTLAKVTLKQV